MTDGGKIHFKFVYIILTLLNLTATSEVLLEQRFFMRNMSLFPMRKWRNIGNINNQILFGSA